MNYKETLDWLFKQLPMYQRDGKSAYKADLNNTHFLMDLLNHPEKKFKSIHVGGTNGKGSVSHMLAALFQSAGYKTGLYTSPHLTDFRERIRINGEVIPQKEVVRFITNYKSDFQSIGLSFFEMTVGMAFHYFAEEKVDIAIVEVGMGGRLDSTNVILPELSIITNISLDHTAFLGNDKASIAKEKAGIIKKDIPIIIGEKDAETEAVFKTIAQDKKAPIEFASWDKAIPECDLKGIYQKKNVITVLSAARRLEGSGYQLLNQLPALNNVGLTTGLRGRWEQLSENPRVICDTGHNFSGVSHIIEQLKTEKFRNLRIVWGMVNDKEVEDILQILPENAIYYLCQAEIPRAMDVRDLELSFGRIRPDLKTEVHSSVEHAFKKAKLEAQSDDLIFIGGSTFVVAELF